MMETEIIQQLGKLGPAGIVGGCMLLAAWKLSAPLVSAVATGIREGFGSISDRLDELKDALIKSDERHHQDKLNDQALIQRTAEGMQSAILRLTELGGEVREMRGDISDLGDRIETLGNDVRAAIRLQ